MVRIGVDIRGLLTGQRSGIEQYTLKTLEYLLQIDKHNKYVLFYVSYRNLDKLMDELLLAAPFLRQANVEIKTLKWINAPLLLHALWKPLDWPKVDKICGGLDVMWSPSPRILPVSKQCRVVITFHDLIFDLFPQFYTWQSNLWHWQMSYRYLARTADHIIAVSQNTKADLIKLYQVNSDKIRVIYEGVDEAYFHPVDLELADQIKAKFNIKGDYIYYIGSLEPRKNLVAMIRALNYLHSRGAQFDKLKLVVSSGKSWLTDAIHQEIDKLQLKSEIIFTGPISEAEKIVLLQQARAFIFPTLYEGFGLPVIEAMAAGCPVVAGNNSALPEVAADAAILVEALDQIQINLAVEKILTNPDFVQSLVSKGKLQARKFNWQSTAEQTLEVLSNGGT